MPDERKTKNEYLRYAGLGFEILACILLFAGLGYKADQWAGTEKPWFLLGLTLLGCGVAMYLMIRRFMPKSGGRKEEREDFGNGLVLLEGHPEHCIRVAQDTHGRPKKGNRVTPVGDKEVSRVKLTFWQRLCL